MNNRSRIGSRTLAIVIAVIMIASIAVPSVSSATTEEELTTRLQESTANPAGSMNLTSSSSESFVARDKLFRTTLREPLPLSIKIWTPRKPTGKVSILECGSGLNPESNYNTSSNESIVEYLLGNGTIVVGIIPRENNNRNQEALRYLDLNSRANDLERVVRLFKFLPDIEVVGHSAGAMPTLLMASRVGDSIPNLRTIRIIDMDILYKPGTEEYQNAWACYNASKEMLEQGVCIAEDLTAQRELAYMAKNYPNVDSGVPRPEPLPGNFTFGGLFYSSRHLHRKFSGRVNSSNRSSGWLGLRAGILCGRVYGSNQ